MKGLIFNLLADLARDTGCEEDAWQVALAVSEEVTDELALTDDEEMFGLISEVSLQGGANFTFRWLLRSGSAFRDDEWRDLADAAAGRGAVSEAPDGLFLELEAMARRRPNRE